MSPDAGLPDLPEVAPLHVALHADGTVLSLTFDHGKANEVGTVVLKALERLVLWLRATPSVRVLVTRSTKVSRRGTPLFVAGADVTERMGWDNDRVLAHVRWQRDVLQSVRALPLLHIAVVRGVALGWGLEYLLTADVVLGVPGTSLGVPETGLGIVPGAGGTAHLAHRIGASHAVRLGLTGEKLGLDEAVRLGLVQEAHASPGAAWARALDLAAKAATRSPTASAAFKAAVLRAVDVPQEALALEDAAYTLCLTTGEAARGREAFATIRRGEAPAWGPRVIGPAEDDVRGGPDANAR